jgi:predicted Zn-dependent protease
LGAGDPYLMKFRITAVFIALIVLAQGQNLQVQNMYNYLRNKDFAKAKESADLAAVNDATRNSSKMWMYRGNVYKAIYTDTSKKVNALDADAEEKALEAYVKCLQLDKDKIYKDESDVKAGLVDAANRTNRKTVGYRIRKEYDKALKAFDLLEQVLPFDETGSIKRNNITKEKIMFSKFELYEAAGDFQKTKDAADALMNIKYKDPRLFVDMVKLSLANKDTAGALAYIEKGKVYFEDNIDLINNELNIYLARKKTDVLKNKLVSAIEITPDNEILHFILANLYKGTGQPEEAEKSYRKSLEIKPDYEAAIYNLGVLYYNMSKEWRQKFTNLPLKDPKTKEYEGKMNDYNRKAVEMFIKSYEFTKEPNTRKLIKQIYTMLGETANADLYK